MLTPDGVADGFTLSTFVTGVPAIGLCCGPFGIATNSLGQVVMQVFQFKTITMTAFRSHPTGR